MNISRPLEIQDVYGVP